MKTIIKKIFYRPELQQQPPILIDIGASGSLHPKWRKIAKYCWCIAVDPDQQDLQFVESEKGNFKKLLKILIGIVLSRMRMLKFPGFI